MGDKFNSGGGDEQVAKDQATLVNINDQAKSVNQHTVGNANILAGNGDVKIGVMVQTIHHHFHDKVGGVEKIIPNDTKSYEKKEYFQENVPRITLKIRKCSSEQKIIKIKMEWIPPSGYSFGFDYPSYINKYLLKETICSLVKYLHDSNRRTLKTLAINGSKLFNQLFRNDDRDNDRDCLSSDKANKAKEYLTNQRVNTELRIESDVDIPWNCIYMGDIECISMDQFWGNRYNISCSNRRPDSCFISDFLESESSDYITHENSLENLQNIKYVIACSFNKTIHLDCCGNDQVQFINNMKYIPCTSSRSLCSMIEKNHPDLLFIYFDEIYSGDNDDLCGDNDDFDAIIKIGEIKIKIDLLKRTLSKITKYPPFIILFGRKIDDKIRTPIRELFIMQLNLQGVIFIESDVPLGRAAKYLHDFFVKFTEGNHSISNVLFELRKKYEDNIGLAFTVYYNHPIRFKKITAVH